MCTARSMIGWSIRRRSEIAPIMGLEKAGGLGKMIFLRRT